MSFTSTSKAMMKYQYQLNEQAASTNRNWQERLANSAHQREIADLKAAGLNPVLSVTGGSGATTPSGATASVSDGAGYASALANLEAARINSATQMYMHTIPSANSFAGQVEYFTKQLGIPLSSILQSIGDEYGLSDPTVNPLDRIKFSDLITLGPKMDTTSSGKVRNLKSNLKRFLNISHDDMAQYVATWPTRMVNTHNKYKSSNSRKYSRAISKDARKSIFAVRNYPYALDKAYGSQFKHKFRPRNRMPDFYK